MTMTAPEATNGDRLPCARHKRVAELRVQGLRCSEIADRLGYGSGGVVSRILFQPHVKKYLAELEALLIANFTDEHRFLLADAVQSAARRRRGYADRLTLKAPEPKPETLPHFDTDDRAKALRGLSELLDQLRTRQATPEDLMELRIVARFMGEELALLEEQATERLKARGVA